MCHIIAIVCTPPHHIERSIDLSNVKLTVSIKVLFVADINVWWDLQPISIDKEIDIRETVYTSTSGQSILKRHFIVCYSDKFMKL